MASDQVQLLAPVDPPNVFAIGLNYTEHAKEGGHPIPERPVIFIKAATSVIAHGRPIELPELTPDEVDYEAELAIIIGKTARNVSEDEALNYVLGYTCANDVSARDCQLRLDVQWARGKSFDTFCPMGPWIETDLDPDAQRISLTLSGETLQDSNTSDMIFNTRQLVSYLSKCFTLLPGTAILTGTPQGVGCARTPARFLKDGDTAEVTLEGIGTLSNPVTC